MNSPQPPRLASFLLQRLGPHNEPLVGDLLEERANGRSRTWYWRQVLIAVISGAMTSLQRDKWLALRAVALAIGIQALIGMLVEPVWEHWLSAQIMEVTQRMWGRAATTSSLQWAHTLLWFPASVCVGWLLATLHREERGAVILAVVAFAILFGVPQLVTLISNSLEHQRFLHQLAVHVVGMTTYVGGVLWGGVISPPVATARD
jgi:hypothetical protein